jgi:hypothetical protein
MTGWKDSHLLKNASMKKGIKELFVKIIMSCVPKRIVWTKDHGRGIYLKSSELHGERYITIAVTNKATNIAYITHVHVSRVIGIQRATTPIERWLYKRIGINAPSRPLKGVSWKKKRSHYE